VGIGTLYRRFPDRQALLHAVAVDTLERVWQEAGLALAEEPDTFRALARYMHRALDLRVGMVMPGLISQLSSEDAELLQAREQSSTLIQTIIDNAHAAGTLRPDVAFADISLLIVRLSRPLPNSFPRALDDQLAHRHLDLLLDGLRMDPERSNAPLPGPAMTLTDLRSLGDDIKAAKDQPSG
jgi:AcrR family transcriptional regulator